MRYLKKITRGSARVDWSNPLTNKLAGLFLFNEGGGNTCHDCVSPHRDGTITSGIWKPEGLEVTSAASGYVEIASNPKLHISSLSTVFVIGTPTSITATARLFQSDGATTNYTGVSAQINGTTGLFSYNTGDNSGSSTTNRRTLTTATVAAVAGVQHSVAFVVNGYDAGQIYVDGINRAVGISGSYAGSYYAGSSNSQIGRLKFGGTIYYSNYTFNLIAVFDRQLSANEIKSLHHNPEQLIVGSNPLTSILQTIPRLDPTNGLKYYNGSKWVAGALKRYNGSAWVDCTLEHQWDICLSYDAKYFGNTRCVTPTYDGSGQGMHPSVVKFATAWNGYTYWMAMTPYPLSDATKEDPSVIASNDGINWVVPAGLTNPLQFRPGLDALDHNSDCFLYYHEATDELWLYYIENKRNPDIFTYYNTKSSDGVTWSARTSLGTGVTQSASLVKLSSTSWRLYFTYNSALVYRTCSDADPNQAGVWSANIATTNFDPTGYKSWHTEVQYYGGNYKIISFAVPTAWGVVSSQYGAIFTGTSADGVTWTMDNNALVTGSCYKAAWVDNGSTIEFWWSGVGSPYDQNWYTYYVPSVPNPFTAGYVPNTATFEAKFNTDTGMFRRTGSGSAVFSCSPAAYHSPRKSLQAHAATETGNSTMYAYLPPTVDGKTVSWWMYDDGATPALKIVRFLYYVNVAITPNRVTFGVFTTTSNTHYVYTDKANNYTATSVPRTTGWHHFSVVVGSASLVASIDGVEVATVSIDGLPNALTIETTSAAKTIYYIDDVKILN